jgi:hypothetical protein
MQSRASVSVYALPMCGHADKLDVLLLLLILLALHRRELYDAAAIGDVDRVLCAMAHGADLSWSNEAEGSNTAAHQVQHTLTIAYLSKHITHCTCYCYRMQASVAARACLSLTQRTQGALSCCAERYSCCEGFAQH